MANPQVVSAQLPHATPTGDASLCISHLARHGTSAVCAFLAQRAAATFGAGHVPPSASYNPNDANISGLEHKRIRSMASDSCRTRTSPPSSQSYWTASPLTSSAMGYSPLHLKRSG